MTNSRALVLVVMGVSGSGKSTVAAVLAGRLGWDFAEGDDLHPAANIAKMTAGTPLTDDDRWPWLHRIADWIDAHLAENRPGIVTCSALKRSYRDVLRRSGDERIAFVFLDGGADTIAGRLIARHQHFMPPALLNSQFTTLEPPDPDEHALRIDVEGDAAAHASAIIDRLGLQAVAG